MPLVSAAVVLDYIETYRVVYIGGVYGSYKTALAFRLAYELFRRGTARYLLSNIDCVWRDSPLAVVPRVHSDGIGHTYQFLDTVFVLDEGGLFINTQRDADPFMAFMRKFNSYLFIPSIKRPAKAVRDLSIYRLYNFTKLGLPLMLYRCIVDNGVTRDVFHFWWKDPSEIWGVYNTYDKPVDDGGLLDFVIEYTERGIQADGQGKHRRKGIIPLFPGEQVGTVEGGGGAADALQEAAAEFSGVVSILEQQGNRRKKRRN